MKNWSWEPINERYCFRESLYPVEKGNTSLSKYGKTCFDNVLMLPFNITILCRGTGACLTKNKAILIKI